MTRERYQGTESVDQERFGANLLLRRGVKNSNESHHHSTNAVGTAEQNGDALQPKSRVSVPGDLDPQIGSYRTDAPTTSWVAAETRSKFGSGETFDVGAAFQLGMPLEKVGPCQSSDRWFTRGW